MTLKPYKVVLSVPGMRSLMLVALLARVPSTMTSMAMTLYVVLHLERGYGAAGLAGAAMTLGMAVGAPVMGRLVDRRGLRTMLALTMAASGIFWFTAQAMPYPVLLVAGLLGGLLSTPVFGVVRQSIAALVPQEQRRPAYALDSMSVEISFMVGPALAVLLANSVSPRIAMVAVGAGMLCSGLALFVLNPPTSAEREQAAEAPPVSRREWLTPRLLGMLAITAATTLVLGGTDVAVVAVLREADQVAWTGAVLACWSVYSLIGGFAYGAVRRSVAPPLLVLLLGVCTIPIGLGGGQWWMLALALVPAGALCAPSLAATADTVSRLAPAAVRGEAMGLHNASLTMGVALGGPAAGAAIDLTGHPALGFAATGLAGALIPLVLLPGMLRRSPTVATADPDGAPADQRTPTPVG